MTAEDRPRRTFPFFAFFSSAFFQLSQKGTRFFQGTKKKNKIHTLTFRPFPVLCGCKIAADDKTRKEIAYAGRKNQRSCQRKGKNGGGESLRRVGILARSALLFRNAFLFGGISFGRGAAALRKHPLGNRAYRIGDRSSYRFDLFARSH